MAAAVCRRIDCDYTRGGVTDELAHLQSGCQIAAALNEKAASSRE